MVNFHPIFVLTIVFVFIILSIIGIYAFDVHITLLQAITIIFFILFTLIFIGSIWLINKLTKNRKSEHVDLESKSREFIQEWYRNLTGEELTIENSSYQQRYIGSKSEGEMFALWKFARRVGGQSLGVIVGTKPKLYIAKWDWIMNPEDLETLWKELSPTVPGYPSRFAGPEDTIYLLKRQPPKEIKETIKEKSDWRELAKGESEKEKEKSE